VEIQSVCNQGLCPIMTLIARQVCERSSFVACLQPSVKLFRSLSSSTISAFVNGSLGGKSQPTSSSERQNERRTCISLELYQYHMQYLGRKETYDLYLSISFSNFFLLSGNSSSSSSSSHPKWTSSSRLFRILSFNSSHMASWHASTD
jgi:hypothetical protein